MATIRISEQAHCGEGELVLEIAREGCNVRLVIRSPYDEARYYTLTPDESQKIGTEFIDASIEARD